MAVGYTVATEPEAVLEGLRPFGQWKLNPKGTAERCCLGCLNGLLSLLSLNCCLQTTQSAYTSY